MIWLLCSKYLFTPALSSPTFVATKKVGITIFLQVYLYVK